MRRALLAFFVFLLLGILLSLVFRDHQGYMLLSFNGWQVETSLLFFCIALIIAVWVLLLIWRILTAMILAPGNVRGYFGQRRQTKARRSFNRGLLHWSEAAWSQSESELRELDAASKATGLGLLFSARAAQHQSHLAKRDDYLDKAAGDRSVSERAVLATRAELQAAAGQHAEASATLARLHQLEPRNSWVLQLYAEQLMATEDYESLYGLIPALKKYDATLSDARIAEMASAAYRHRLSKQGNPGELTREWRRIPKGQRSEPAVVLHYTRCLHRMGEDDEAANVIRDAMEAQFSAPLVLLFGELSCGDRTKQLATAEHWINSYGNKPELLLVAGRLCLRNQLWGRARSYFEAGQKNESTRTDSMLELGRVYERINESEQACETYKKALEMSLAR